MSANGKRGNRRDRLHEHPKYAWLYGEDGDEGVQSEESSGQPIGVTGQSESSVDQAPSQPVSQE